MRMRLHRQIVILTNRNPYSNDDCDMLEKDPPLSLLSFLDSPEMCNLNND